jgi:hypothetical protein
VAARRDLAPLGEPSRRPSGIASKMPYVSAYERRILQDRNRYGGRY